MTTNASGQISLSGTTAGQSVALEIDNPTNAPISLNDVFVRSLAGIASGSISLSNLYSKTYQLNGSLWSWGDNGNGQLGNGTNIRVSSPIQVGSLTTWNKISYRRTTTFSTRTDGTLWGWGNGVFGLLNLFTISFNTTDVAVSGGASIGGGSTYSTADYDTQPLLDYGCPNNNVAVGQFIRQNGALWVSGTNNWGQLGIGTTTNISSPVQVGALTNWKQLSCGYNSSLALKTDGTIWSWGNNGSGQLGSGTTLSRSSPVQIGALTNWKQIATAGSASFAINTSGQLYSWGANGSGQLGSGTTLSRSSPVQIGALTNWKQISGSSIGFAVASKTDGTIWSWGYNANGQLGTGNVANYSSPVQIGTLTNWNKVNAGFLTFLSIKTDGTLWGCGYNGASRLLVNSTASNLSSPIQVSSLTNWKQISCGGYHWCAVKTDGTLWANGNGGSTRNFYGSVTSPVQVGSLTHWRQVYCGIYFSYAYTSTGTMYAAGQNSNGYLGAERVSFTSTSSPIQIGSLTTWNEISSSSHVLATRTDGTLWTWGNNGSGQLGIGNTTSYSSPVQIGALTNWKQVSSGNVHTATIKTDGTLWTWGNNGDGQLGTGNVTRYSSPVQIGALTNWKQVSCGEFHTAIIKTDGTLWVCGYNIFGQLGTENTTRYSSPVQIGALTNWKQVSCGDYHTATIKTDGTLWTWGGNGSGQLGSGTTVNRSSPVQIGSLSKWKNVSSGGNYTGAQFITNI
jgi:alpha-tubulin suppressor-like RCC1 family protein